MKKTKFVFVATSLLLATACLVASTFVASCGQCECIDPCVELEDSSNFDCCGIRYNCYDPSVPTIEPPDSISYGELLYEGQTYKTVVIGTQTWMAENLNYKIEGSKCFGEEGGIYNGYEGMTPIYITLSDEEVQANCDKYGSLYSWTTAMNLPSSCNTSKCESLINSKHQGICPEGWYLPTGDDWRIFVSAVGGRWNAFGFSALLGGWYDHKNNSFTDVDRWGLWWTASTTGYNYAYYWLIASYPSAYGDKKNKTSLLSVRCIKN